MVLAHSFSHVERTQDVKITQDVTFDSMLLSSKTLKGLLDAGFSKPSPIQLYGIPIGKCGFDLLLEAKSGTGKTAVFSVITLEKIDLKKGLQAVVLAPTREIAAQICDVMKQIGSEFKGLQIEVVMGGLPVQDDIEKFKNKSVHVVVGSPGRLKHLIQDKHIDISSVRLLILDEADKLMEKSFQTDILYIFTKSPKQKQVIMSSATYPESSKTFINQYVKGVQHICPDSNSILLGIIQKVTFVKNNSNIVRQTQLRFQELLKIINTKPFKQCLIFCNYQARIAELHKLLTREKWPAEQLYGQQEQTDRLGALKTLQEYKCRILICTDLAARGIDASNVDLVINFEPPFEWQTYLHRIGRAGRFGSYGIAISILSEGTEVDKFKKELELMKHSLDIRNLWTDEPFKFNKNDSCEDSKVTQSIQSESADPILNNKEIYNEFWQILTTNQEEMENSENELESFEQLCKSLEESKDQSFQIESFSDLLESYKNNEFINNNCTENDNSYPNLKVRPVSKSLSQILQNTNKYMVRNKSLDVYRKSHKPSCENIHLEIDVNSNSKILGINKNLNPICIKTANNHRSNENLEKNSHDNNIITLCSNKDFVHPLTNQTDLSDTIKQNGIHLDVEEKLVDIEEELIQMNRDLLNSGLPLAFSSTKFKSNKCNRKSKTNTCKNNYDEIRNGEVFEVENSKNNRKPVHCFSASYNTLFDRSIKSHTPNLRKQDKLIISNDKKINSTNDKFNLPVSNHNTNKTKYFENQFCSKVFHKFDYIPETQKKSQSYFATQESDDSSSCDSSTDDESESESEYEKTNLSKHYYNWYSQLKLRVQQIQYALYLEEISKM